MTQSFRLQNSDSAFIQVQSLRGFSTNTSVRKITASRVLLIEPAFLGKSAWNLDSDGPLDLGSEGIWVITPISTLRVSAKAWGAGGRSVAGSVGGGGGYAGGIVKLLGGSRYSLYCGRLGPVGDGGYWAGGGGYSGIRFLTGEGVLIAGGGGGAGNAGNGGAGGGLAGQSGLDGHGAQGGNQSAGGLGGGGTESTGQAGTAWTGGSDGLHSGSQGGDGYFGGGGGGSSPFNLYGAGGGSGYLSPSYLTSAILNSGSGNVPGNSSDVDRNGSGLSDTTGRLRLS